MRFLQTLHLKQCAWYESSPVMIASSRMGCLQTLQLYEQLAHMGEPSERSSRFVSAVTWFPHFAHLKQSTWKKDWLRDESMVSSGAQMRPFTVGGAKITCAVCRNADGFRP